MTSADGYFLDSHQLDRIVSELLIPFQQGADEVLRSAFDEPTDTTLESVVGVPSNAVLVFDGLFLHRDEFANLPLLEALCKKLGTRATLKLFQEANHSFHVPARTGRKDAEVKAELVDAAAKWIGQV